MDSPLQIQKVSVFSRNKAIVDDVSWQAKCGQINAIIGPNGAGKSTLLKAIMGIIECRGTVLLENKAVTDYSGREGARKMAWVPQISGAQLPLPVDRLVAQGRFPHLGPSGKLSSHDRAIIQQALVDVNCDHLAHRSWTTLSGGERRRTMIARALATEARVLLLDEPTASLDIEHALRIMELMRTLAHKGYTIVPVLHDLNLSRRYADNVLILNHGKVAFDGDADTVLSAQNIAQVYNVDILQNRAMDFSLRGPQ